jgi:hypothetical protein
MGYRRFALCVLVVASLGAAPAVAQQRPLADVPQEYWAHDAVMRLAGTKIVEGYPDGSFQGRRALTRYELAVALTRFKQEVARNLASVYIHPPWPGRRGDQGPQGAPGETGAAGPVGPPGARPAEFDELKRDLESLRNDTTRLREFFGAGPSLPKAEVQDVWAELEALRRRTRRAAKPIPGILRR